MERRSSPTVWVHTKENTWDSTCVKCELSAVDSFFLRLDEALLGDEDTIEELTFILVSDVDGLADLGTHKGDSGVVEAFEDELVLNLSGEFDGNTVDHVDVLDLLTSKEVLDVDAGAVLGDDAVNGEMSMDGSHLVHVAFGDTDAHVLNVGLEGVDGTSLLVATEPHADSEPVSGLLLSVGLGGLDLTVKVREVLGDGTSGTGDLHNSGLNGNGINFFRDAYPIDGQQSLHDVEKY